VRAPTLAEIRRVIGLMPTTTDTERRDRAVVAFIAITGARVSAVASFRLGHINIERRVVFQDARDVRTKFRKTFETWFFPVGDDLEQIIVDWVRFLLNDKGWGTHDPLFPSTDVGLNDAGQFGPIGLARAPWSSTGPVRDILREAFRPRWVALSKSSQLSGNLGGLRSRALSSFRANDVRHLYLVRYGYFVWSELQRSVVYPDRSGCSPRHNHSQLLGSAILRQEYWSFDRCIWLSSWRADYQSGLSQRGIHR
jgi:hypothetical protein